jgi:predicted dehydrogenase
VAPVKVVSLCDPDQHMLAGAAKMVAKRQKSCKEPQKYTDYRKMLAAKDLDIVLIATPDQGIAGAAGRRDLALGADRHTQQQPQS